MKIVLSHSGLINSYLFEKTAKLAAHDFAESLSNRMGEPILIVIDDVPLYAVHGSMKILP